MRTIVAGIISVVVATAALGAHRDPAERGRAELAKAVQGYVAGTPQSCLSTSETDGSYIIGGAAIVFHGVGGRMWVNRTKSPDHLREDDIPVQFLHGGQMCRLDRVKLLDRGSRIEHWVTVLDDFVPYTKVPKR